VDVEVYDGLGGGLADIDADVVTVGARRAALELALTFSTRAQIAACSSRVASNQLANWRLGTTRV